MWHSDVSYEEQPSGFTSFKLLTTPPVGGDGVYASAYAAYDALSPALQKYCETLYACHSGVSQAKPLHRQMRRPPREAIHPVVRVHPVTGWKSIYVDPSSTRYILNIPKAESEMLLGYLFDLVVTSTNIQCHFKWTEDAVAFFDNRCVIHSSSFDFYPYRRHAIHVMCIGERPMSVEDAIEHKEIEPKSQFEDLLANGRIPA
jgi:sulfonate dioxygenase